MTLTAAEVLLRVWVFRMEDFPPGLRPKTSETSPRCLSAQRVNPNTTTRLTLTPKCSARTHASSVPLAPTCRNPNTELHESRSRGSRDTQYNKTRAQTMSIAPSRARDFSPSRDIAMVRIKLRSKSAHTHRRRRRWAQILICCHAVHPSLW